MTYELDHAQIFSSTTYYNREMNYYNRGLTLVDLGGLEELYNGFWMSKDMSEEFRVSHTGKGSWQWTFGGFYKHFRDIDGLPDGYYFGFPGPPGSLPPGPYDVGGTSYDQTNSWSAFGDTSYKLFDRLTIGAGVRYFRDRESEYGTGTPPTPSQAGTFTSTDPRVYVQYQLTPDINTYVSAAKGFRSGGFNQYGYPPYGPESVWSYELGTKMRLLDRRLSVDADVFYSNYSDYVTLGLLPIVLFGTPTVANVYSNSGFVRIKGVEGTVAWRPVDEWTFSINAESLSAKFVEINAGTGYHVGEPVDLVPPYSFTGSVERGFRVAGKTGYARLDYSEIGRERDAGAGGIPPRIKCHPHAQSRYRSSLERESEARDLRRKSSQ